jgi:hypothetical protein
MSLYAYDPLTGMPKKSGTAPMAQTPIQPFANTSTSLPAASVALAPTAAASAGAGGAATGAGPGSYQWILENDPFYQQILRDLSAQGISDEAGAKAAAQRALIAGGEIPEGLDPVYSQWVDEQTRALASRNTEAGLSLSARLAKHNKDQIRALKGALRARGGLRSGELGFQLGEEDLRYRQGRSDMTARLVDTLSGISAGLAAAKRARAMAQSQAGGEAYGRGVASGAGAVPPPPEEPTIRKSDHGLIEVARARLARVKKPGLAL